MLPPKESERTTRPERQVLRVKDLDDDDLEAIRNSRPSRRSNPLRANRNRHHFETSLLFRTRT